MRKVLLLLAVSVMFNTTFAQTIGKKEKFYYACKVWGYVKYFHPAVSVCSVNWDSVLVSVIPKVTLAVTDSEFNDVLDSMLAAAGPVTRSTTYFPDTLPPELKRNKDATWISSTLLRNDVQAQLDTIKNNFRPHDECWVELNTSSSPNISYLLFPFDSIELNVPVCTAYPDESHRLLMFFKYWNVIRYFYPYNYIADVSWDSTLMSNVVSMDTVSSAWNLFLLTKKITANLEDLHVEGFTYSSCYFNLPGYYQPRVRLAYVDTNYTVLETTVPGIHRGDRLLSVDGLTMKQWEDSLKPYISAGNIPGFRRQVSETVLGRMYYGAIEALTLSDSLGAINSVNSTCVTNYWVSYSNYFYPTDSLADIKWTLMGCDVGYVNMGNLQPADVAPMYNNLREKSAIIFDLRNYPNVTAWAIVALMYPISMNFTKLLLPDVTYPGTYYWGYESSSGGLTPYTGKVFILVNEITQSQAEYTSMMLRAMPNALVVGSQTAGADGNISYWQLSDDISVGMTTLGVFYPNQDSTQRIGIVPDSIVYPTNLGIRQHNDEVLNKALSIACEGKLATSHLSRDQQIKLFPNPAENVINVDLTNAGSPISKIQILSVTGKTMLFKNLDQHSPRILNLDISSFPHGYYFIKLFSDTGVSVESFLK